MEMPKLTKCLSVAAIVLAALTGAATAQQDFPTKPIQLMVAFPAGGSTDIAARIVASIAEKALGQPIVVVNRGDAGGQIGWTELVRQKDRKSTRLNSSHLVISYAVLCLKKR